MSTTNGAGGVLDRFHDEWKLKVTLENKKYSNIMQDLYDSTYKTNIGDWKHPYGGKWDGVWAHVDRVGYRLPDSMNVVVEEKRVMADGAAVDSGDSRDETSKAMSKKKFHQRSLTPHLDCCPDKMHSGGGKEFPRWRPIQCFVSLVDTLSPNHGGFECAKGFHREFDNYYKRPRKNEKKENNDDSTSLSSPLPCVSDYVHIRPRDDAAIMERLKHVDVPAGAAVFWDQRIPHANAYQNQSNVPREVVYGGFLPRGIKMNDDYAREQWRRFLLDHPQPDFWTKKSMEKKKSVDVEKIKKEEKNRTLFDGLSEHAKSLLC